MNANVLYRLERQRGNAKRLDNAGVELSSAGCLAMDGVYGWHLCLLSKAQARRLAKALLKYAEAP